MAEYEVRVDATAAKEFGGLPTDVKNRVAIAIRLLRQEPRPVGVRKLRGTERLYRIRIGHYRVIYEIQDRAKLILVLHVRHRRDAYR